MANARGLMGSTKGSSTAAMAMGGADTTHVETFSGAGSPTTVTFTDS